MVGVIIIYIYCHFKWIEKMNIYDMYNGFTYTEIPVQKIRQRIHYTVKLGIIF